jgi:NTP pyrophosphatase (non-canonical NTP hydrolase)
MSVEELEHLVIEWAEARDLYRGSTTDTRMEKVREEVEELYTALIWGDDAEIRLEAGDVIITVINAIAPLGITLRSALDAAYHKIKDRQGRMINGTFVRDK